MGDSVFLGRTGWQSCQYAAKSANVVMGELAVARFSLIASNFPLNQHLLSRRGVTTESQASFTGRTGQSSQTEDRVSPDGGDIGTLS